MQSGAGLAVLNGRYGPDSEEHTCVRAANRAGRPASQSVVDYMLMDGRLLGSVGTMRVVTDECLLEKSDHRPVPLELESRTTGYAVRVRAALHQMGMHLDGVAGASEAPPDGEVRIIATRDKLVACRIDLTKELFRQQID